MPKTFAPPPRRPLSNTALAAWLVVVMLLAGVAGAVSAAEAQPTADDPVLEARVQRITTELRCLVCQNQTVADSHAGLADDLRREVRRLLREGASDTQVLAFMTQRYGDFVLYRPPVKNTTALLWFGPAVLLVLASAALALTLRRRARLAPEAFDPEPPAEPPADPGVKPHLPRA